MSLSNFSSNNDASVSSQENGFVDSLALLNSEKAVQELVTQPLVRGMDDHLIEFSEAMRTVAKALRQVAEGKASAQAEAAEWKRKYELERARNMQLEHKVLSSEEHSRDLNDDRPEDFEHQPELSNEDGELSETCCGQNGICSHEVLQDGETEVGSNTVQYKFTRKASFKLSWCCKGEKNDQDKHDIVSFDKGDITTAERNSKQISLKWESPPQTRLIMTKPNSTSERILCADMVRKSSSHGHNRRRQVGEEGAIRYIIVKLCTHVLKQAEPLNQSVKELSSSSSSSKPVMNNSTREMNRPASLEILERVTINKPVEMPRSTIKGILNVPIQTVEVQ